MCFKSTPYLNYIANDAKFSFYFRIFYWCSFSLFKELLFKFRSTSLSMQMVIMQWPHKLSTHYNLHIIFSDAFSISFKILFLIIVSHNRYAEYWIKFNFVAVQHVYGLYKVSEKIIKKVLKWEWKIFLKITLFFFEGNFLLDSFKHWWTCGLLLY